MASDDPLRLRATLLRPVAPAAKRAPGSLLRYDLARPRIASPTLGAPPARGHRWLSLLSPPLLYLGAALLLLLYLDGHPSSAYNWEVYSARHLGSVDESRYTRASAVV